LWGHDWYIYAFARANNYEWFIDENPYMLYLQRSVNETGVNLGLKAGLKRMKALYNGWFIAQSLLISQLVSANSIVYFRLKRFNFYDKLWFVVNFRSFRRSMIDSVLILISIFLNGFVSIEKFESGGRL
jgi:rhamnosyltransferase